MILHDPLPYAQNPSFVLWSWLTTSVVLPDRALGDRCTERVCEL